MTEQHEPEGGGDPQSPLGAFIESLGALDDLDGERPEGGGDDELTGLGPEWNGTMYKCLVVFVRRKLWEVDGIDMTGARTPLPTDDAERLQQFRHFTLHDTAMDGDVHTSQHWLENLDERLPMWKWLRVYSSTTVMLAYVIGRGWMDEWIHSLSQ